MQKRHLAVVATLALNPLHGYSDHEQWTKMQILSALSEIEESPETLCSAEGIESSAWIGKHDEIAALHGGLLSPYDGFVFPNYHYVEIEHIVSRKEADESGMCNRSTAERREFATDSLNLTFAPGSLNASKGDDDAHDLETARISLFRDSLTEHGLCWWAAQSVRVKAKYDLSADANEKSSLSTILSDCSGDQVYRPRLQRGSNWSFRSEFLSALSGEPTIPHCSAEAANRYRMQSASTAVSPYLSDIACITHSSRTRQITAQNGCVETLKSKNLGTSCRTIEQNCPDVGSILRGEPLYEALWDSDADGVVCEHL